MVGIVPLATVTDLRLSFSPRSLHSQFTDTSTQLGITDYVDVTGTPMAAKSAGYVSHRTQWHGAPGGAAAFVDQLKVMGAAVARNAGAPDGVLFAEGFTATVNPYAK